MSQALLVSRNSMILEISPHHCRHKYCARAEHPLFLFFCSQSLTLATVFLPDKSSRMVRAVFMPVLVILSAADSSSLFYGTCAGLGHQSVRITEKHYAPWVRSRQEQLEADLVNAWSRDPLVLLQTGVHQKYAERSGPTTRSSSIRRTGARGGSRTHMRKNPRRILSPQRLPFRHPGRADKKT